MDYFNIAFKQTNNDPKIGYNIGMCYLKLGKQDEAMKFFKQSGSAIEPHLDAKINESILLRKQNKVTEALTILDELVKQFPFNSKVLLNQNIAFL